MDKLFDYQKTHVENMVRIKNANGRVLDSSRPGLGKTYTSIVTCIETNSRPFIVTLPIAIKTWVEVLEELECDYIGITSYELLQRCKMYNKQRKKVKCDFINYKDENIKSGENVDYVVNENNLFENMAIIYDEVHKSKNAETNNAKILKAFGATNIDIIMLSATVAEKPVYFILTGLILKLYRTYDDGQKWLINRAKMSNTKNFMLVFHNAIYPNYACKMNDEILLKNYPNCKINAICYDMHNNEQMEQLYVELNETKKNTNNYLKKRHNIKIRIELMKVLKICKEIEKQIANNKSVVVFVNYKETVYEFMRILNTQCAIFGDYSDDVCENNKNKFNNDEERIIICTIKKASTSISLHDLNGNHARTTYIMPPDSVLDLIQSIGRVWRAGVLTESEQNIVFSNCPEEQKLQYSIIGKINNISLLNNGNETQTPLLKIDNLIEETKDIVTEFGKKIKISKTKKNMIKKEMADNFIKEQKRKQYLQDLRDCNNYKGLLYEMKKLKNDKNNNNDELVISRINEELAFIDKLIDEITDYY